MTLKNFSFSRSLFANRFGRDSWLMLLYGVLFFFNFPVNLMLGLPGSPSTPPDYFTPAQAETYHRLQLQSQINRTFYDNGSLILPLLVMMGIFSAVWLFSYLHRQSQVDFYHAQPVRRSQIFSMNLFSGLLYFAISLAANLLLCVVALLFSGHLYLLSALTLLRCFFWAVYEYLILFSLSIFVGMLTGTIFAHLLACGTVLILFPAIVGIPEQICSFFYKTYFTTFSYYHLFMHLTPIFALGEGNDIGMTAECGIYYAAVTLLLLAGAFLLYQKRSSESAGIPVIYPRLKKVLHLVFTLILALFGGALFPSFTNIYGNAQTTGRHIWFVFGFFIIGFLSYMVIQAIFEREVRACYRRLGRCALALGAFFLVLCIPLFDLTHHDEYLPEREDIVAVGAFFNNFDDDVYSQYLSPLSVKTLVYESPEAIDAAYAIAQSGVAGLGSDSTYQTSLVYLRFHLKNGKTVSRCYYYAADEVVLESYPIFYDAPEGKAHREAYGLFTFGGDRETNLWISNPLSNNKLAVSKETLQTAQFGSTRLLTPEEKENLINTLNQDILDRTFDAMSHSARVVSFQVAITLPNGNETIGRTVDVLGCDKRTLALLKEYGIPYNDFSSLPVSSVTVHVDATYYGTLSDALAGIAGNDMPDVAISYKEVAENGSRFTVTDPEQVKELMSRAVLSDLVSGHYTFRGTSGLYLEVEILDNNYVYSNHFLLPEGQVPDFLKAELEQRKDKVLSPQE